MAAAAAALVEVQLVAVGRIDVRGAVVSIDDCAAAVLLANGQLLAALLNAGARRISALAIKYVCT